MSSTPSLPDNLCVLHLSSIPYYTVNESARAGMPSLTRCVEEFAIRGWRTIILYPSEAKATRILDSSGAEMLPFYFPWVKLAATHRIPKPLRPFVAPALSLELLVRASRLLHRLSPDLLYCHGPHAGIVGTILGRLRHTPVVTRLYGFTFPEILLKSRKGFSLRAWADRMALALKADLYVITDDGTKASEVARKYRLGRRALVLPNGVDVPAVVPSKEEARRSLGLPDTTTVCYVGRMESWKRPDRVLRCAARAHEMGLNWFFVMVGDGADLPVLRKQAEEMNLSSRVYMPGAVPHADVWTYLAASDVFVSLPSLSSVSNTLIEALAIGIPVVCSRAGDGLEKWVIDGVTGIQVSDPEDVDEVVRGIARALEMGACSRRPRVVAGSWKQRFDREFELIYPLLRKRSRR